MQSELAAIEPATVAIDPGHARHLAVSRHLSPRNILSLAVNQGDAGRRKKKTHDHRRHDQTPD